MYAATEHGLDSCCVCNFDPALLHGEFDLPDNMTADALILLGYKCEDCKPSERHFLRKSAEEFTFKALKGFAFNLVKMEVLKEIQICTVKILNIST